jgi:hypothetical protein
MAEGGGKLVLAESLVAESGGKLVLAERQKVDVDELLVNFSDFQQNRSADSGDTVESIAQRSTEFDDLFDGVPNPMCDSETELTEAEANEQKERAGLEREITDARAELEAPRRSLCSAFFSAFLLRDLWLWIRSPASLREPVFIFFPSPEALEPHPKEMQEMHDSKTKLTEAPRMSDFFFIVLVLSYIFLCLSPIVLTVVAVSRGEHANLSTTSWLPALVPLVVHGILVTAYLHWAMRLDQMKKHEIRNFISEMERMISKREAHRKGSDANCAAISEDEAEFFSRKDYRLQDEKMVKKMVEFRQKHGCNLAFFALFVAGIFLVGTVAAVDDDIVISLKPEFPYRPQFLGASFYQFLFRFAYHIYLFRAGGCSANGTNPFCTTKTCAQYTKPWLINWNSTSHDLLEGWSTEERTRLNITHAWRRNGEGAYPYGGTAVMCTAQEPDNENSTVLRVDFAPAAVGAANQSYTLIKNGCPISGEESCARDFCTCASHLRLELFEVAMMFWIGIVYEVGTILAFTLLFNLIAMVAKEEVINEMIPADTGSVSFSKYACVHISPRASVQSLTLRIHALFSGDSSQTIGYLVPVPAACTN